MGIFMKAITMLKIQVLTRELTLWQNMYKSKFCSCRVYWISCSISGPFPCKSIGRIDWKTAKA